MTHASFFTGIGGFEYGARAAGIKNISMCENDPYKKEYLIENFPGVKILDDITKIKNAPKADIWSAGFPCRDISIAKTNAKGIHGPESSLVFPFLNLVTNNRPGYVILENSSALLIRGMEYIIAYFTKIGYCVEWKCLQASDFGFPHKRQRIFIIAYTNERIGTRTVFQPLKTFRLSATWTPGEIFLHVHGSRSQSFRNVNAIKRDDVIQPVRKQLFREIGWYGDAVMPVITEYLFKCILKHNSAACPPDRRVQDGE